MTDILLAPSLVCPFGVELLTSNSRQVLTLRSAVGTVSVQVELAGVVDLPDEFFTVDSGVRRLKSLQELRRQVANDASYAAAQLEAKWQFMVAQLSRMAFVLDANTGFLGAQVFPIGAVGFVGRVELNLSACLSGGVHLQASLIAEATLQAELNGAATEVGMRCHVEVSAATPRFSISFPTLGLQFPSLAFPHFDWATLAFDGAPTTFKFPTLPGLPIEVTAAGASVVVQYDAVSKALNAEFNITGVKVTVYEGHADLDPLTLKIGPNGIVIGGIKVLIPLIEWSPQPVSDLPAPLQAVKLEIGKGELQLAFEAVSGKSVFTGCLKQELTLFPGARPNSRLTLSLTQPFQGDSFLPHVDINGKQYEQAIELLAPTKVQLPKGLFEYLPNLGSVRLELPMPDAAWSVDIEPLLDVLGAILSAVAGGLSGLARVVESGLRAVLAILREATQALNGLGVTLLFDARSGQLQQLLLSLHRAGSSTRKVFDEAGFELTVPVDADLALLIDLRDGERDAYFVLTVESALSAFVTLGTDLWFAGSSTERAAGQIDGSPTPSHNKLINLTLSSRSASRVSIVPFAIRHGQAVFLYALDQPLPAVGSGVNIRFGGYKLVELADTISGTLNFSDTLKDCALPFLAVPRSSQSDNNTSGIGKLLEQYIEIESVPKDVQLAQGKFIASLGVKLHVINTLIDSDLILSLDARRMSADLTGGLIKINMTKPLSFLGMSVSFIWTENAAPATTEQFILDLRQGDGRMYLNSKQTMLLDLNGLGADSQGRPVQFRVDEFVVHSGGLDLTARLSEERTIHLNGLETDFTFKQASLKILGGKAETCTLSASGKLPPALLGDVDASLYLTFGQKIKKDSKDKYFGLLDGGIDLACKGKPIRCDLTHFSVTLNALTLRAFEDEQSQLHFCAFVSGSAVFEPQSDELVNGMLKQLDGVELKFNDCPLSGPSEFIARELEKLSLSFVVALKEPIQTTLFGLFHFEIRSLGFEPNCPEFASPATAALIIGGQVLVSDTADVIRAECDANRLCIAAGNKASDYLPRVRCENWGIALRLGSALELEGLVAAVDGRMPKSLLSEVPDNELKSRGFNGFMGQGRVAVQGLPAIAVSFGFVEMQEPGWAEPVRAWFVYLEAQRLSYYFQLGPVPFYLREAGLGLGFYFTYVGIKAIDDAKSLPESRAKLDELAATAVEPAKLATWSATAQGDPTLVARVMISMSSASAPPETLVWRGEEEKELPNLLLLNALVAVHRSTFLMTANAWLGFNYSDWNDGRRLRQNELVGKQAMTGYVVVAAARSEFLARLKSNPGAEIGPRLAMPDAFKSALTDTEYDATLYIRPGLLHFELGWPNRIRWTKNIGGINLSVFGGAIFRVYEDSLLVGMNIEGQLDCAISGRLDAGVVGIAVSASLSAAVTTRIIGYLDSRDIKRSLYYSLYTLQVCIRFEVSAWLEIDAFLCKITIRASFAVSLQIDVVAEMALQGDASFGSRIRATIAISIFGRTLGLSVGLGMNPGLVDQAANRVGRFMNLSLIQDVPSQSPPVAEQDQMNQAVADLGNDRREARNQAAGINLPGADRARVPHEDAPKHVEFVKPVSTGNPINGTNFQIVLSNPKIAPEVESGELLSPADWVYLSFLPLDAETKDQSSFYAAQREEHSEEPWDHIIDLPDLTLPTLAGGLTIYRFASVKGEGRWVKADFLPAAPSRLQLHTAVDWEAELLYTESNEESQVTSGAPTSKSDHTKLQNLFFAAFRTTAKDFNSVSPLHSYMEPAPRAKVKDAGRISSSEYADSNRRHLSQESGYSGAISVDPADRRCHEARDFLLHKFISDLFELTTEGRLSTSVNVLHLGLTLLVPRAWATALANLQEDGVSTAPPNAPTIVKRVGLGVTGVGSTPCRVFNPPHLTYAASAMGFRTNHAWDGRRAMLDWDLLWEHPQAAEKFLQHYEIRRWITIGNDSLKLKQPLTVRRADQEEFALDSHGQRCRNIRRNPWQFIDEFADLSPADRARLFDEGQDVEVKYTVTPVCVSGTRGPACSNFCLSHRGKPSVQQITRAQARLTIDPVRIATAGAVDLQLAMDWEGSTPGDKLQWRLIARGEAILPAGQYGTDGEVHRSIGGRIGVIPASRADDVSADIPLGTMPKRKQPQAPLEFVSVAGEAQEFLRTLKGTVNPRAWKLYVQSVVKSAGEAVYGELYPVDLSVELKGATEEINLVVPVDALELVQLPTAAFGERLLAPILAHDLSIEPGRAVQPEPAEPLPDASLALAGYQNVTHPEFGAVSKLSWNLRPSDHFEDISAYRLISGFEILRLSLDGTDLNLNNNAWQSLTPVSSVRLQSASNDRLIPGALGEPAQWKARYPSTRERRLGKMALADHSAGVIWPVRDLREELLPEPPSNLIRALLRDGPPHFITLEMTGSLKLSWEYTSSAADNTCWRFESPNYLVYSGLSEHKGRAAESLRSALRALRGRPVGSASEIETVKLPLAPKLREGWSLTLTSCWSTGPTTEGKTPSVTPVETIAETLPMPFDRELHPLLEAILTRMARLNTPDEGERLLTVDRRPPPILDASTIDAFMSVSSTTADPMGWAILDRLGLGVTLRLFDPSSDEFLTPGALLEQFSNALKNLPEELYSEARKHLFVDLLLKPGGLTRKVRFSRLAGKDGEFDEDSGESLIDTDGLSMVHISLRPLISMAQTNADLIEQVSRFHGELRAVLHLEEPKDGEEAVELNLITGLWKNWNLRYLKYAAVPVESTTGPVHTAPQYAFAALEATQSLMAAPDVDGKLSVMVPEADGYEHRRAFAVMPIWRYAGLLASAGYEQVMAEAMRKQREAITTTNPPACAIALIERTAPVQSPSIIALERLGNSVWWRTPDGKPVQEPGENHVRLGSSPGHLLPVLLPHHLERRLIRSNLIVARNLAHLGTLSTGALMLVDERWCQSMLQKIPDEQQCKSRDGEHIGSLLTEQLIDHVRARLDHLPAQARVRVFKHLPQWYRHAIVLSAGSGVCVSEPIAAYLPEAPAWLVEKADPTVREGHPWEALLIHCPPPPLEVSADNLHPYARIIVDLPAIRYRDTTDALTARLWSGPVANLADPVVVYDLELHAESGALQPRASIKPLARIARQTIEGEPVRDTFSAFAMSRHWYIDCLFASDNSSDDPRHLLKLAIAPMSEPVAVEAAVQQALGGQAFFSEGILRVPGGWSVEWLDVLAQAMARSSGNDSVDLVVKLFAAMAQARIGLPDTGLQAMSLFARFSARQLQIIKPPLEADQLALSEILRAWLTRLQASQIGLVHTLAGLFAVRFEAMLKGEWPAEQGNALRLVIPWVEDMAKPDAPVVIEKAAGWSARYLVPELMTDAQYQQVLAAAANPNERIAIETLREAQKQRALAGGKLLIRASRGDVVTLELPAMSLK